jgi:hypothetical protein
MLSNDADSEQCSFGRQSKAIRESTNKAVERLIKERAARRFTTWRAYQAAVHPRLTGKLPFHGLGRIHNQCE